MDEETIRLVEAYLDGQLEVFGQTWSELPRPIGTASAAPWTMWPAGTGIWAT